MELVYPAIFIPCKESPGYTVEVPDLPGCVTEGENLVDAIEMGIDAACGWILDEMEDGNDFPVPRDYNTLTLSTGSFINFLVLDMNAYAEKYNH